MAQFPASTLPSRSPTPSSLGPTPGPGLSDWGRRSLSRNKEPAGATPEGPADSTVALPLRAVGALNGLQLLQYWPFSSSDLYNWKVNHPPFSENPAGLTGLIESLMYSHQPTWDNCQQLLQTLFTTGERERILLKARKNV